MIKKKQKLDKPTFGNIHQPDYYGAKKANITIKSLPIEKDKPINTLLFCDGCHYINPSEVSQTSKKEPHICNFTGKIIKHKGHHPKLPRPEECQLHYQ